MVHPALFWEALGQHQQGTPRKYKSSMDTVPNSLWLFEVFIKYSEGFLWAYGSECTLRVVRVFSKKEEVKNPSVSSVF